MSTGMAPVRKASLSLVRDSDAPPEVSVPEVSIVMPCLNEAETLQICIEKALSALKLSGIKGEVIVADNGSSDGSRELAQSCGARVVPVDRRGYGAALMGG